MKNKSLFLIAFSFLFASCTNLFDPAGENQSNNGQQSKLTVSASTEYSSSRSAIPSALPSGAVYFATLSYVDGGTTKYLGQKVINTSEQANSLCFVYETPAFSSSKDCTLTVYAFVSGTTEFSENYIASGSAKQTLSKGQLTSNFGAINLVLNSSNTGNGTVELGISIPSGVTLYIGSVYKGGVSYTLKFEYDSSNKKIKSTDGGIESGVYTLTFVASENNERIDLENPVQMINVAAGMKTDNWLVNGELVTTLAIKKASYTTFYVCGSNDTKKFYGTSGTSGLDVNGSLFNSGSLMSPKATLAQAVALCTDTTKSYTIYVDGTTSESLDITIDANTTIKALSTGAKLLRSGTSGSMITVSSGKELTLEGITIDGASNAVSTNGAGIKNNGTLTLTDCVIQKCKVDNSLYGGAIYTALGSNLYIYGSTKINNNSAGYGAAISVGANNSSTANVVIGKSSSDNVEIHDNAADILGGAIMASGGARITMNSGLIYDNTVGTVQSETASKGGALYLWGDNSGYYATFTMNGGKIYDNKSLSNNSHGGAVYIDDERNYASFTMTGGIIYGNTATSGKGNAIWHAAGTNDNAQLKLSGHAIIKEDNDIFLGNGKFVTVAGTLTPTGTGDASGAAQTYTAYITSGALPLRSTTILKAASGDISSEDCDRFKIKNAGNWNIVLSAVSPKTGILDQVIFVSSKTVTSSADDTTGDGSKLNPYLTINKALSIAQSGSTIYVRGTVSTGGVCSISNKTITISKYDSDSGDAIIESADNQTRQMLQLLTGATLNLKNVTLDGKNKSIYSNGAGIYVGMGCIVNLENTIIQKCETSGNGGAIYIDEGTATLTGTSEIKACSAAKGSGIYSNRVTSSLKISGAVKFENDVYLASNAYITITDTLSQDKVATITSDKTGDNLLNTKVIESTQTLSHLIAKKFAYSNANYFIKYVSDSRDCEVIKYNINVSCITYDQIKVYFNELSDGYYYRNLDVTIDLSSADLIEMSDYFGSWIDTKAAKSIRVIGKSSTKTTLKNTNQNQAQVIKFTGSDYVNSLSFENIIIDGNCIHTGADLYISNVTFNNCVIQNCSYGGGIYFGAHTVNITLENVEVRNCNTSYSSKAGGISISTNYSSTITFKNVNIQDCSGGMGGLYFYLYYHTFTINGLTVKNNTPYQVSAGNESTLNTIKTKILEGSNVIIGTGNESDWGY